MNHSQHHDNIKACPVCGTNLIITAKHCAVCNYRFTEDETKTARESGPKPRRPPGLILVNLPVLLGLLIMTGAITALVILGMQKRDQTRDQDTALQATSTYLATTYLSPTPTSTLTSTPGPPTSTPIVYIEYEVVSGDSCLSIIQRFNIDLGTLLSKNEIDCALLNIGTKLKIPQPTAMPEVTGTAEETPAP
jgi:LysM repeat protein